MTALNLMTHEIDDEVFYLLDENGDFVLDDENAENCCCAVCVCSCEFLEYLWNNPGFATLDVAIAWPGGCAASQNEVLFPSIGSPPAGKTSCHHWGTSFSQANFPLADIVMWCDGATVGVAITNGTTNTNCIYGAIEIIDVECSIEEGFRVVIEVEILPGDPIPEACPCDGEVVSIIITGNVT